MKGRRVLFAISTVLVALAAAPLAQAQATRTWVSGTGDDAFPCSRTAPCKTFAGAYHKTAAGGQINAIDPGGYGNVTIRKSLTITGTGTLGSVLNTGTTGITVDAGANDVVTLRNLEVQGAGAGTQGVRFVGGKALHLRNVEISGQTNAGIFMSSTGRLTVDRSAVIDSTQGLYQTAGRATVTNTQFANNGNGIVVSGGSATVRSVVVSDSASVGVYATAGGRVTLQSSVLTGGDMGIWADGGSVRASDVTITDNRYGVYASNGGQALTRLNNTVADNGTNGAFTGSFGAG